MGKILIYGNNGGSESGADVSVVTAGASDVLADKVIIDANEEIIIGEMSNNGAILQTLNAGNSYMIPKGYHNGSGKVTINPLASQTDGTAAAAQILKDQTAYVDGVKVTGTMANNRAVTPSALGAGGSYTIPAGYHNGSGKVTVQSLATLTASGDATAAQILSGKKAYVDGSLITGTMTNRGAQTKTFTPSASKQTYTIPAGYHNGSGVVTCNAVSNLTAANIKKGVTVGGVTGTHNGYVASSGDLFLYGQNLGGIQTIYSSEYFDGGAIFFSGYSNSILKFTKAVNFSNYSKLNIEMYVTKCGQKYMKIGIGTKEADNYVNFLTQYGPWLIQSKPSLNSKVTVSIDVSSVTANSTFILHYGSISGSSGSGTVGTLDGFITRIWMS